MDNIQQLKQWIDGSDRIVFFGGAGDSIRIPVFSRRAQLLKRIGTSR